MLENNPVTENLGVNTSTDNIPFPTNTILQIETVNLEQNSPNLGGKSFKFTGESLYFDMLHSIPTKIRGGDSFLYILGLGKFEYSPYYFELQEEFLSSHWYRYGRFKFGFTEFIKLNVPQPHTIPKLAAAHTQGISRFRVDSDFTRDLIYYTHEICPEITLNMVADTAITIPITYLA